MNIRTFSSLNNDVYTIRAVTEDWSENDRLLMAKYGEPTIDVGGSFSDGYTEFDLDTSLKRIMTQSPFVQSFDYRDNADAQNQALLWKTTMITRITDAIVALRTQADTFTKEEVTQV